MTRAWMRILIISNIIITLLFPFSLFINNWACMLLFHQISSHLRMDEEAGEKLEKIAQWLKNRNRNCGEPWACIAHAGKIPRDIFPLTARWQGTLKRCILLKSFIVSRTVVSVRVSHVLEVDFANFGLGIPAWSWTSSARMLQHS